MYKSIGQKIINRIERKLNIPALADKLANALSPSDFNSLMTELYAMRAAKISPGDMLQLYAQNGYAKPAECDAVQYRRLELDMLLAARERGVRSVILSPASLFGCCSVFGAVSQNKMISATRNLEMVSDATNMLALHAAAGIKEGTINHSDAPVHLCATHRHIRYQSEFGTGMLPHFGIYTMVSAGKSRSSYAFEIEAFLFHLRFYSDYWMLKQGSALSVSFHRRGGYKDPDGFFYRVTEAVKANGTGIHILSGEQKSETAYYKGLQATLYADVGGNRVEIGDMGLTDWTQKLLNNKSERLLISAMALDRQMS